MLLFIKQFPKAHKKLCIITLVMVAVAITLFQYGLSVQNYGLVGLSVLLLVIGWSFINAALESDIDDE
jgi:membrane protein implicated in regulation of membrane protease activity